MAFPLYYLLGIKAFAPDYLKPAHIQKHLCQLSELMISRADLSVRLKARTLSHPSDRSQGLSKCQESYLPNSLLAIALLFCILKYFHLLYRR